MHVCCKFKSNVIHCLSQVEESVYSRLSIALLFFHYTETKTFGQQLIDKLLSKKHPEIKTRFLFNTAHTTSLVRLI